MSFLADKEFGLMAQRHAEKILRRMGFEILAIFDNKNWPYDFLLDNGMTVEAKGDRQALRTGNIVLELKSSRESLGWLWTCPADILAYSLWDQERGIWASTILYDWKSLKHWALENQNRLRKRDTRRSNSVNLLVPMYEAGKFVVQECSLHPKWAN